MKTPSPQRGWDKEETKDLGSVFIFLMYVCVVWTNDDSSERRNRKMELTNKLQWPDLLTVVLTDFEEMFFVISSKNEILLN